MFDYERFGEKIYVESGSENKSELSDTCRNPEDYSRKMEIYKKKKQVSISKIFTLLGKYYERY